MQSLEEKKEITQVWNWSQLISENLYFENSTYVILKVGPLVGDFNHVEARDKPDFDNIQQPLTEPDKGFK